MKQRSMELWLGLFVLVGLVLLSGLIVLFGELLEFSQTTYEVKVRFDTVTGLRPGTPVRMLGIDIGKVRDLEFRPGGKGVDMILVIDGKVDIPSDSRLTVLTEGLLGDNYLEFGGGTGEPLGHDGDATVKGEAYKSPLEYLKDAVGGFKGTAATYDELARNLNKRLTDEEFFGNLKKAAKAAPEAIESFKATSVKLQELAQKLSAEATGLSTELKNLSAKVGKQVDRQGQNMDKLSEGLLTNMENLNKMLISLHEVTESVRKGEGTIGGLMMRDEVYKEMVGALEQTRKMLEELEETVKFIREHPEEFFRFSLWGQ